MDLISLHTNACIEQSSFSQSAKAIYDASTSSSCSPIIPIQSHVHVHVHVTKEEEVENQQQQQKPKSLDVMLTDLSPLCFILTPSWVSKSTKERIKILNSGEERRYPLIVVRVNVNVNIKLEEAPSTNNDESFLNKFASLKIGTSKETGERTSKSSHATDQVYTAISQIIAREVIARFFPADALPSQSSTATMPRERRCKPSSSTSPTRRGLSGASTSFPAAASLRRI